ncbi:MAG TPA: hypothetical protein VF794_39830 [Archangium sp.]|jgi:hypothetical protein|uniref:hypothetical protein n=1 Tax=Archangium sp. TaxID=1872627 RepID=UPI002ED7F350
MSSNPSNEFSWQEQLELAAQVVAAVAMGGYISHRAHLNRLGIPASTPLSVERYLAEAWYVVSASLELLFTLLLWPLALLLVGSVTVAFLSRRKRLPQLPAWIGRLKPNRESLPLPLGLLLGLLVLLGTVWRQPTDIPLLVAIGPLNAELLAKSDPMGAQVFYGLAMLVWLLCAAVITALVPESKSRDKVWLAWLGCRGMLPLGVVALFMHFGTAVHASSYPSVEVRHGKDAAVETLSGALVLESSESLLIWSAGQGSGVLTSIPREAVQSIRFGPDIDVLARALEEATKSPVVPPSAQPTPPVASPTSVPSPAPVASQEGP